MSAATCQLRPLLSKDLEPLVAVAQASFPKIWSQQDFLGFLLHQARYAHGVFEGENLVAYLVGLVVQGDLDIISVATHPSHRRRGLGKQLLSHCQQDLNVGRITLEVDVENIPAYALYLRMGFVVRSVRKQYYEKTRDAYLMSWERAGIETSG